MEVARTVKKRVLGKPSSFEQRVACVGTQGSGKTTVLGFIHVTCQILTNELDQNFYFRVDEKTSGIRQAPSDLRNGMFPVATPIRPGHIFEADFIMRKHVPFGTQSIRIPFAETAGEEISRLIDKFSHGQYELDTRDFTQARQIYEQILQSNGFIVIAPVTRARFYDGKGMEEEPTLIKDPDVNISRLLECIYNYKESTQAPPIKGIAVLLTKADAMITELRASGMDLDTEEGMRLFMSRYFPETMSVLRFYGLDKVRFWPSGVELDVKPNPQNNNQLEPYLHPDDPKRGYKIKVDKKQHRPVYSMPTYMQLIEWIFQTFTR